jgi:hypothetical protein
VKRLFLNELMMSAGCEISYKARLMIVILARDHTRYSAGLTGKKNRGYDYGWSGF